VNGLPTTKLPRSRAHQALRAAFVARLIRRMKQTGVMASLFSASFTGDAATFSPPHPCASGALHAILKPLCRSGVAAGGAGGGGPGTARQDQNHALNDAATALPLAA